VASLLGLRLEVDKLRFAPCLPADWQEFKIHYCSVSNDARPDFLRLEVYPAVPLAAPSEGHPGIRVQ